MVSLSSSLIRIKKCIFIKFDDIKQPYPAMIKQIGLALYLTCFAYLTAFSQATDFKAGSQYVGLSQAAVTQSSHWATFYNQAALSGVDQLAFGFYAERKFGLKHLNSGAISLAYPFKKWGTVGFSFYQFSHGNGYSQQKYGLALSRSFGENVSAGIQFDAFNTFIREYGSQWEILGEASLLFKLNEQMKAGLHVFNPTSRNWDSEHKKESPPAVNPGLSYQFSEKATLHLAVNKRIAYATRLKAGLSYSPVESLQLQAGVRSDPISYAFGVRYQWRWLMVNMAFRFHGQLGMTPALSTNYKQPE